VRNSAVVAIRVGGSCALGSSLRLDLPVLDNGIGITVVMDSKTQTGGVNVPVTPQKEGAKAGLG
jgi:hypothetical protein